jgi:hypothetical protein
LQRFKVSRNLETCETLKLILRCSIHPVPRGAGREWQSGRAVSSFRFPVSGFETGNMELGTDAPPDADQMRRLIG